MMMMMISFPLATRFLPHFLLAAEFLLLSTIIIKINYTEIDWVAYMQEVEGFLAGELDYKNLKGGTGPLVYPAGFLYLFTLLRLLCGWGDGNSTVNEESRSHPILKMQFIFLMFYLLTHLTIFSIYSKSFRLPAHKPILFLLLPLLCLSKRIHSIFVLRLFNDPLALLFAYLSIHQLISKKYKSSCLLYSIGVSIKMNVFLFAPGLLLVMLQGKKYAMMAQSTRKLTLTHSFTALPVKSVVLHLILICGLSQVLIGLPFLLHAPVSYLSKAFEFDRVFFYKWTVNFKFLNEDIFLRKELSLALLLTTLLTWGLFARKYAKHAIRMKSIGKTDVTNDPLYVTHVLFTSNFVGVALARTLHYQFYAWYYHTIPFLLGCIFFGVGGRVGWGGGRRGEMVVMGGVLVGVMAGIEYGFNVFPATALSSSVLQGCHALILGGLYFADVPSATPMPIITKRKLK